MASTAEVSDTIHAWWVLVLAGIASVIAGILAIAYPHASLLVVALITGINIIILSALMIGGTLGDDEATDKTLRVVVGLLGIVAGIVIVRRPSETLLVVVLAAGIWMVLDGVVSLVRAAFGPSGHRLLRLFGGLFQLAIGIVVLSVPDLSLGTLAVLVGLSFIIHGLALVGSGIILRSAERHPAARPVVAAKPAV